MECLTSLSGCELVTLAAILAVSISQNLSSDEAGILGNFFTSLGDNLNTISSAKLSTQSCTNSPDETNTQKES